MLGSAEVVDQAVDAAERSTAAATSALSGARLGQVGRDVQVADPFVATARGDDDRTVLAQLPATGARCPAVEPVTTHTLPVSPSSIDVARLAAW